MTKPTRRLRTPTWKDRESENSNIKKHKPPLLFKSRVEKIRNNISFIVATRVLLRPSAAVLDEWGR